MRNWMNEVEDSTDGSLIRVRLKSIDDSGQQQLVAVEGIYGQNIGEAVRLQNFGASSVPPEGAEGLALVSGGRYDRLQILGLEHPDHKPKKLPGGAKAIYDASGNIIKLIGSDGVVFDFTGHGWTAKCKGGTITSDGDDFYIDVKTSKLYLGGKKGDTFYPVVLTSGPSSKVFGAP